MNPARQNDFVRNLVSERFLTDALRRSICLFEHEHHANQLRSSSLHTLIAGSAKPPTDTSTVTKEMYS